MLCVFLLLFSVRFSLTLFATQNDFRWFSHNWMIILTKCCSERVKVVVRCSRRRVTTDFKSFLLRQTGTEHLESIIGFVASLLRLFCCITLKVNLSDTCESGNIKLYATYVKWNGWQQLFDFLRTLLINYEYTKC